jgi:DNA helicase IV
MPSELLPAYEDLTPDQDVAIRHPIEKSLIMTGPPGSGKTVVALYRTQRIYQEQGMSVDMIVYSKVLHSYISESLNDLDIVDDARARTFHSWICKYWKRKTGQKGYPPQIESYKYDWDEIYKLLNIQNSPPEFDQLIIDEGQDLPPGFYNVAPFISKSVTVFADMNQAIFENVNTSVDFIMTSLRRFKPREVKLRKNHRNTREIAVFSQYFKILDREVSLQSDDLPDRRGDLPYLVKNCNFGDIINFIVQFAENKNDRRVAVLLDTKKQVNRFYENISELVDDITSVNVQSYTSGSREPDFTEAGIYILTYKSAKGLEFDSVFLPELNRTQRSDTKIMEIYVASTRAKEELYLMYSTNKIPELINEHIMLSDIDEKFKIVNANDLSKEQVSTNNGNSINLDEICKQLMILFEAREASGIISKLFDKFNQSDISIKLFKDFVSTLLPSQQKMINKNILN